MPMTVEAIASLLGGEVRGDGALTIDAALALDKAGPHDISFVGGEKNLRHGRQSRAGAVLIGRNLAEAAASLPLTATLILVDNAQSAFLRLLETLRPPRPRPQIGVSPHARVCPTARIGTGTNVHPDARIGRDVRIGENCDIHPGATIGDGCVLGDNVTVYPNAVLYPDVRIGNNVTIDACAVLGSDGFGYRLVDGRHLRLPHHGTVRIGDDVEVGACTTIDRAMIGETVIGEGTKLDNLVVIAHNCEIGPHNIMVSQVGLAGSVTTGQYVVCAGQVGVADHVRLGDGCVLGAKTGVHKDLPGGRTYLGSPAMSESEAARVMMSQKKLPELRKQVKELQARVDALTSQLQTLLARDRAA